MNRMMSSLLVAGIGTVGTVIFVGARNRPQQRGWMQRMRRNQYFKAIRKAYRRAF